MVLNIDYVITLDLLVAVKLHYILNEENPLDKDLFISLKFLLHTYGSSFAEKIYKKAHEFYKCSYFLTIKELKKQIKEKYPEIEPNTYALLME